MINALHNPGLVMVVLLSGLMVASALIVAFVVFLMRAFPDPKTVFGREAPLVVGAILALGVGIGTSFVGNQIREVAVQDLNADLSAKYGHTIERRAAGVWLVDGEPRQGILTDDLTLLISGRELDRPGS